MNEEPMKPEDQARLVEALRFALEKHGDQPRKGKAVPYASHLLGVASHVLEHSRGDVELAVAGLLHDVLEDSDEVIEDDLRERFGGEVARIVAGCSDTLPGDTAENKSPWRERKERYLEQLVGKDRRAQIVAACDKLHNLQNIVADVRVEGLGFMKVFKASPEDTLWYYRQARAALREDLPPALLGELDALLETLGEVVEGSTR